MAEVAGETDNVLVVRAAAPSLPRWLVYFYTAEVVFSALLVASHPSPFRWVMLAFWLVGLGLIVVSRTTEARRPAELILTPDGLTSRQAFGRTRHFAWEEVTHLRVDPPGSRRMVSVHLRSGGFRRLLRLQDDDAPSVLARWTAVQQRRQATQR